MFSRFLFIAGVGAVVYYNYIEILKWTNHCYRWLIKIDCLNPSYVNKVVHLNDKAYYYITLKGRQFITTDKEHDLVKYDSFRKKMAIPNSPDNILEADIFTTNGDKIDVLEDIQLLCGPFVDQCTNENRNWIFNYLADEYNGLESPSDIKELVIELINGDTIKLT